MSERLRLWWHGLAVAWVWRIMKLPASPSPDGLQVVVVKHWPRGWSLGIQKHNPDLNMWYGTGPVPVTEWSRAECKRYLADNPEPEVDA